MTSRNSGGRFFEWPFLTQPELESLASSFASQLRGGEVVCLDGPMGAGKTCFVRAMARGLGIDRPNKVASPTYTLSQLHRGRIDLMHVDLHRLGEEMGRVDSGRLGALSAGFEALGLDDVLRGGSIPERPMVIAVEWPEFWPSPPHSRFEIALRYKGDEFEGRYLVIRGFGSAEHALAMWQPTLPIRPSGMT
jgi:tRNA threonylcarbamoyl adenosine modification protein YjeE